MRDAMVSSPCVGVCKLDPDTGYCVGCLRNAEEIMAWPGADAAEKMAILSRLPARKHKVAQENTPEPRQARRRVG
jgi:predicted Fe-S protein YdhL (DUF1289 family)